MILGFKWFPQYEGTSNVEDNPKKSYHQRWLEEKKSLKAQSPNLTKSYSNTNEN
jgi:hypothetical protein